jgi:hypothetical protein
MFKMAGPPIGDSIDEMRRQYEKRCDREFRSHLCAEYPRVKNPKS